MKVKEDCGSLSKQNVSKCQTSNSDLEVVIIIHKEGINRCASFFNEEH